MTIRMAYEMVMPYHLHMPSYFLETFTEYPFLLLVSHGKNIQLVSEPYRGLFLCFCDTDKFRF
nr:MAG TPA: hypothetical protein [Caudoviricetes sp.]